MNKYYGRICINIFKKVKGAKFYYSIGSIKLLINKK